MLNVRYLNHFAAIDPSGSGGVMTPPYMEFDQIGHKRLLWKIICTRDILKDNNTFKEAHYAA